MSGIPPLLSDEPIDSLDADVLHRSGLISQLRQLLTTRLPESSLVIALTGRWGEGKSSVLRMLAGALENDPQFAVTWFQPWHYESLPETIDAFFECLESATFNKDSDTDAMSGVVTQARNDLRRQTHGWSRQASANASVHLFSFGRSASTDSSVEIPPSIHQAMEVVSKSLLDCDTHLLVFTEDIDRLSAEQARRFFSLLFTIRQTNNLTILIPVDIVELRRILGTDSHLIVRLIDVDIPLPAIEDADLQDYSLRKVRETLVAHGRDIEDTQWQRFELAYIRAISLVVTNLRDAKRWINAIDIGLSLLSDELDWADLCLLQCLRISFPEHYALLDQLQFSLVGGFSLRYIMAEAQEKEERKAAIGRWLELSDGDSRQHVEAILGELVPRFAALRDGERPSGDFALTGARRFASADNYARFLLFRPERNDVPFAAVDRLWADLADEKRAAAGWESYLRENLDKGSHTFDRLLQTVDKADPSTADRLVAAIARQSADYDSSRAAFVTSQEDRARVLLYAAANRVTDPHASLVAAVREAASLDFASGVVFFLMHRDRNEVFDRWEEIRPDEIQSAFGTRVAGSPQAVRECELPARVLADAGPAFASRAVSDLLKEGVAVEEVLSWFVQSAGRPEPRLDFDWLNKTVDVSLLRPFAAMDSKGEWTRAFLAEFPAGG